VMPPPVETEDARTRTLRVLDTVLREFSGQIDRLKEALRETIDKDDLLKREMASGWVETSPDLESRLLVIAGAVAQREVPDLIARLPESAQIPVFRAMLNEITALGPLTTIMADRSVTDIVIDEHGYILADRGGGLMPTGLGFRSPSLALEMAQRVAERVGRQVNQQTPIVDASLPDGSRVHVIIPPVALGGPRITIRLFPKSHFTLEDLIAKNMLDEDLAADLVTFVKAKANILVAGGTGTGKTTMLRALAMKIPDNEYVVTIEDTDELAMSRYHHPCSGLVTRTNHQDKSLSISMGDLLVASLRMRPDRIVVGEVRGPEASSMLDALLTGHDGGMSTVHAASPLVAITARIAPMAARAEPNTPLEQLIGKTSLAFDLVVQIKRKQGRRVVSEVAEVAYNHEHPGTPILSTLWRYEFQADKWARIAEPTSDLAEKLEEI
jgi:pilus assembly protein CpaF